MTHPPGGGVHATISRFHAWSCISRLVLNPERPFLRAVKTTRSRKEIEQERWVPLDETLRSGWSSYFLLELNISKVRMMDSLSCILAASVLVTHTK